VHSFAYLFERYPSFVQTFCYREVEEMLRQGMNPFVVSVRRPDDPPGLSEPLAAPVFYLPEEKTLRAEIDRRRETHALPRRIRRAISRHRGERDSQRLFEAIWLAPELKTRGIRHVHAHFGGLAARTAWWLCELYGFRYSFTGHANDIFCETDFPVTNAMLVRDARLIVTETDYARRWLEQKHPAARGKTFRVFNGIDTAGFPPRRREIARPRLVSIGRYVEKKGFPDLIAACEILRDRGHGFECLLIGGGPMEATLREQIDRSGLVDQVRLLGPKPQAEVRELLATADLFVLPCIEEAGGGSDNLPTVIMEAMACGVPVISTPIAGVPEMIASSVDGLLVPPRSPAGLAAAIEQLLADPALAARLAAAGQATAHEKFAIARTTAALKDLLIARAGVRDPASPPALWQWLRRWISGEP
jgi:colanic acid/amylovoran biosynthesis glycosyltransferase